MGEFFTSTFNLPYARHYNPRFVYVLPTFWSPKSFFQGFFLEILSLCMVSIQRVMNYDGVLTLSNFNLRVLTCRIKDKCIFSKIKKLTVNWPYQREIDQINCHVSFFKIYLCACPINMYISQFAINFLHNGKTLHFFQSNLAHKSRKPSLAFFEKGRLNHRRWLAKGQTNSKWFFQADVSSKKRTKNSSSLLVDLFSFVFWELKYCTVELGNKELFGRPKIVP